MRVDSNVSPARGALLQMLQRYRLRYPDEQGMVERIAQLVATQPNCFERSCLPGHLTGSAWVVSADRQRVVLVHHRKLGRWLQPGGHADGEEDLVAVSHREAVEETGLAELLLALPEGKLMPLDVDVHWIPPRYDAAGQLLEPGHEHHDFRFMWIAADGQSLQTSEESHAVEWFDFNQVRARSNDESVLRLLEKGTGW